MNVNPLIVSQPVPCVGSVPKWMFPTLPDHASPYKSSCCISKRRPLEEKTVTECLSMPTSIIHTTSSLPNLVVVKNNNPNGNKTSRSIRFDESVRVRLVPYHSSSRIHKLWYREEDYDRFRSKIQSLAALAKEYQKKHGKPIFMPGMEKWIVEDNMNNNNNNKSEEEQQQEQSEDTTIPPILLSTRQLRSQSIGSVMMEQYFQKQQGGCVFNEERLAALYKVASHPAEVLARQRAARIRQRNDRWEQELQYDDDGSDSTSASVSSVSSDASSKAGILSATSHHHASANCSPPPSSMLLMPASRAA
ncbi:hypothetical protein IV203_006365 [Nitzschia inconspicua]|uniref:Uncharacterized protein n=1 Tax=Nitzschia inconspicua TaxID=303405 RepID=A0A9K3KA62_9STRA|nr:hypothetical protein IV203_006365 [Nitzschia inconspicua]